VVVSNGPRVRAARRRGSRLEDRGTGSTGVPVPTGPVPAPVTGTGAGTGDRYRRFRYRQSTRAAACGRPGGYSLGAAQIRIAQSSPTEAMRLLFIGSNATPQT